MPQILIGLLVLFLAIQFFRLMARTPPATIARYIRGAGGLGAIAGGLLTMFRGRGLLGATLSMLGAWLGAQARAKPDPFSPAGSGRTARVSTVRTAALEMELDLDTGAMRGAVIAGPHAGRRLDGLSRAELVGLREWAEGADPEGARLLETYLDRFFPGWGEAGERERNARGGARDRRARAMTEEEAYKVLGLLPGASREDIVRAHRALMKETHPDHGGATDLAARINEARDVLIRRHT